MAPVIIFIILHLVFGGFNNLENSHLWILSKLLDSHTPISLGGSTYQLQLTLNGEAYALLCFKLGFVPS